MIVPSDRDQPGNTPAHYGPSISQTRIGPPGSARTVDLLHHQTASETPLQDNER